jgi:large subunit ribosomal protein L29
MKIAEIREQTVDELHVKEQELDDQLFRLRIQKSMGQLEAPAKIRDLRRSLARVKTILREKQPAPGSGQQAAASRQPAEKSKPAAGSRQRAAGSRRRAAGSRQRAAGSRQRAAGSRQ